MAWMGVMGRSGGEGRGGGVGIGPEKENSMRLQRQVSADTARAWSKWGRGTCGGCCSCEETHMKGIRGLVCLVWSW